MNLKYNEKGLIPAIVQDVNTKDVLMMAYMNEEALQKTKESGWVTFYSRSKERLWMKGESSGNKLQLVDIKEDCDADTLLLTVKPLGPACHKGTTTCWGESNESTLTYLERIIEERKKLSVDESYLAQLFDKGINKIAQKVGEEAVELVIEAKDNNEELFLNEAADLLFHYLILLNAKEYRLSDVLDVLESRKK